MKLVVRRVPGCYAVARLAPSEGWPWWATRSLALAGVVRTAHETSVVCEAAHVPQKVIAERDLAAFAVDGPIPFSAIGVLAALAQPLAAAGVSVFTLSTYDTDYILVREPDAEHAAEAWRAAGLDVVD